MAFLALDNPILGKLLMEKIDRQQANILLDPVPRLCNDFLAEVAKL